MSRSWLCLLLLSLLSTLAARAQSLPGTAKRIGWSRGEAVALDVSGAKLDLAVPDTIHLGTVRVKQCDSITIPLQNNGGDSITIDSIYLSPDTSVFSMAQPLPLATLDSGATGELVLRFCPTSPGGVNTALFIVAHRTSGGDTTLFRIGVRGDAGVPRLAVDRAAIEFGNVSDGETRLDSFTISNRGDFPLEVEGLLTSTPYYRALPVGGSPPFLLAPDSSRWIIVEFSARGEGDLMDSLTIVSDSYDTIAPLMLHAHVLKQRIGVEADSLDVGDFFLGECHDTILVVRNLDDQPLTIRSARLLTSQGLSGFDLLPPILPSSPRVIPANDTIHLLVRFCPRSIGESFDRIEIEDDVGLFRRIWLKGNGIAPLVWLDTASAFAGEHMSLAMHLSSRFTGPVTIGSYRVKLHVSPEALFPSQILAGGIASNGVRTSYEADGSITIDGDNGRKPLVDRELFRIEFRGLSTGQPENLVHIDEVILSGIDSVAIAGHGLVQLSGCDVGRDVRFGRKVNIRSIALVPLSSEATVVYIAPEGSAPSLRLFCLMGEEAIAIQLPEGTGEEQTVSIPTGPLCREIYILELRDRNERAAVPVMIAK